ncbi:NACHT domain-containing protein [Streptomyces sp. NPDC056468]|uniref:NACHT domain-containing protein n=1 Tax=Streptomyces sp. NPDC056468 TaxID=3345830 RepID=UPI0036BE7C47
MGEKAPRIRRAQTRIRGLSFAVPAAAVLLVYVFQRGDLSGLLVTLLLGVPASYVAWESARRPTLRPLADIADELAVAVKAEMTREALVRGLSWPHMQVPWMAEFPNTADGWALLASTAREFPGGAGSDPARWAAGPADFTSAHAASGIGEAFMEQLPTRRLVVLGDPGAGKTTLLVRLALDLLARREETGGGPVPVFLRLHSWRPDRESFRAWLDEQLSVQYPCLGDPASAEAPHQSRVKALLQDGRLILILDGLDELGRQWEAQHLINAEVPAWQPIVISSRTSAYRDTELHSPLLRSYFVPPLSGAVVITLNGLNTEGITDYWDAVTVTHGRRFDAEGWASVRAQLTVPGPLAEVLGSPLMLALARETYDSHLSDPDAWGRNPADLRERRRFPTSDALREYLMGTFVRTAYNAAHGHEGCRFSAEKAQRILRYLAHQPHLLAMGGAFRAKAVDVITGAAGVTVLWLALRTIADVPQWLPKTVHRIDQEALTWGNLRRPLAVACLCLLIYYCADRINWQRFLRTAPPLVVRLSGGMRQVIPPALTLLTVIVATQQLHQLARQVTTLAVVILLLRPLGRITLHTVLLTFLIAGALVPRLPRIALGQLPWLLGDFLEDAHQHGVLIRSGQHRDEQRYEFRHAELLHHLIAYRFL